MMQKAEARMRHDKKGYLSVCVISKPIMHCHKAHTVLRNSPLWGQEQPISQPQTACSIVPEAAYQNRMDRMIPLKQHTGTIYDSHNIWPESFIM